MTNQEQRLRNEFKELLLKVTDDKIILQKKIIELLQSNYAGELEEHQEINNIFEEIKSKNKAIIDQMKNRYIWISFLRYKCGNHDDIFFIARPVIIRDIKIEIKCPLCEGEAELKLTKEQKEYFEGQKKSFEEEKKGSQSSKKSELFNKLRDKMIKENIEYDTLIKITKDFLNKERVDEFIKKINTDDAVSCLLNYLMVSIGFEELRNEIIQGKKLDNKAITKVINKIKDEL